MKKFADMIEQTAIIWYHLNSNLRFIMHLEFQTIVQGGNVGSVYTTETKVPVLHSHKKQIISFNNLLFVIYKSSDGK